MATKSEDTKDREQLLVEILGGDTPKRQAEPLIGQSTRKKLIAFGWYGGKYSHLPWLLPLLPVTTEAYCEPFGGSAAVILNRDPRPVETYNDLDGEVVNFFRTLRDNSDELVKLISLTPFSRDEYELACQTPSTDTTSLERARRFYVRARQTRTGLAQVASVGRWANCIGTSRAGMSGVVSRWVGGADKLEAIANRLAGVQIENRPALDIMRIYDSPETLFYLDPPYLHETRSDAKAYGFEMDTPAHTALAKLANSVDGLVALSGYDAEFMRDHFKCPKWNMITGETKTIHSSKAQRKEALWVNYDISTAKRLPKRRRRATKAA